MELGARRAQAHWLSDFLPRHVMKTPPGSTPGFSVESHPHGRYPDSKRAARKEALPKYEGHNFRASRDFRTFAKIHLTASS